MTLPAVLIGLTLLAASLQGVWSMQRLQRNRARLMSRNVRSLEVAQVMEIRLRQVRAPVGGDAKVYILSQEGELTVISAQAQWEVLHRADFREDVFATPALVDGRIYLRTAGHLYCFGVK